MQAVTLLIKDALTRPRAFSHINRRGLRFRVFSEDESDNNVSEDEIRLHFRNWCKERDKRYASAEVREHVFQLFKRAYQFVVKCNADPNVRDFDLYKFADRFLLETGIRGTRYGGRAISMEADSIDGRENGAFTDQTSCGGEEKAPKAPNKKSVLDHPIEDGTTS